MMVMYSKVHSTERTVHSTFSVPALILTSGLVQGSVNRLLNASSEHSAARKLEEFSPFQHSSLPWECMLKVCGLSPLLMAQFTIRVKGC